MGSLETDPNYHSPNLIMCKQPLSPILAALLFTAKSSLAVTLVSGPVFVPATNAPLAGLLRLTTDVESRISVAVQEGTNSWTRNFSDFTQTHAVPLLGFKPGRTNQILVTVCDKLQNTCAAPQPLTFVSAPLPADFPNRTVLHSEPSKMEPGFTLFIIQNRTAKAGYLTILDNSGEVVWYSRAPSVGDFDVRQMANGDLFMEEQPPLNRFVEINMLGEPVQTWTPPAAYPINDHEGVLTDHGTILYLADVSLTVSNFPSNVTNANPALVNATVDDNPVVELSVTNGTLLHVWSPMDLLDPTRVTYLTYDFKSSFGVDNEHANAVLEDPADDSIIVSLRTQNAVFKFLRSTGQLKWILGSHANWATRFQPYLLTPVGTPFEWNYAQHAPEITPQRTLLLYDDGNYRANPLDPPMADQNNYSRAVEFSINETNMEVSQVWDSTLADGDRLYTPAVGDADWLAKSGNVLVTYGLVSYVNGAHPNLYATNASMVRIRELTHDPVPKVVFDLSFFDPANTNPAYMGYLCYRSDRIPDLYVHPAIPVTDLVVSPDAGGPVLKFSADPARTYTVEASSDLSGWQQMGTAIQDPTTGLFVFQDAGAVGSAGRFYRVVTH